MKNILPFSKSSITSKMEHPTDDSLDSRVKGASRRPLKRLDS